ncbi:CoA transferase subunit A [Cloacibacillus evryensis]|uniref:CoA transferase subunit A n=1 Tax=Cloacibacillus evryensis TaxID=508460 RepID=UPI000240D754|nr:3-oxoacid CoA-transferase subunit A [Cloacibacillus evryensis]EHL64190.1 3-oxoacid CoA-transferase, A subunit [Synergistes sp. 3_1_syn1]
MAKPFIKPVITAGEAAAYISPGSSLMIGGFNYGGAPYTIIEALCESGVRDIDLICVDTSYFQTKVPGPVGVARLVTNGQLRSLVASHIGLNKKTQELYTSGELKIELIPMGTFVERIRAGGAGLGGILTPTGVDTVYEEGRDSVELDGRRYIIERPLKADVAFIRAYRADAAGNLIYYGTNRNFNPTMATAAAKVVAEVDEVVPIGGIAPDDVITPGIFIDALVLKGEGEYASRT